MESRACGSVPARAEVAKGVSGYIVCFCSDGLRERSCTPATPLT
jgi:hypothetical protein